MRMEVLKRSRKLEPGDLFVYRLRGRNYGFGRVIRTDCTMGGFGKDLTLVYIYDAFGDDKHNPPPLSREKLLIPPKIVTRRLWTKGYFETVQEGPLKKEDVLRVHCFLDVTYIEPTYVDEDGRRLRRRVEPCGDYGYSLEGAVEIDILMALGIKWDPDEYGPTRPGVKRGSRQATCERRKRMG